MAIDPDGIAFVNFPNQIAHSFAESKGHSFQHDGRSSPVFELTRDLRPLFARAARNETLIVIDVPIGILSGSAAGAGRVCDGEARSAVGPRRSSVFMPPSREAFGAATRLEASERNSKACGLGVGCQSWGILARIEAVDAMMTPALQGNVREGDPEVTFARLKGSFLEWPKKSTQGRHERLEQLREHGINIDVDAERLRLGRGNVARDDIIDAEWSLCGASACGWSRSPASVHTHSSG
jgi:predicted RNase H-like nuclease